jgi:hypothetical protein
MVTVYMFFYPYCTFVWWELHLVQEEEQRLRKVALNISKDVKKFWTKIEKLVKCFIKLISFDCWHNFHDCPLKSFISSFVVFLGSLQASNGTRWEEEKGTGQTAWVSFRSNWEVVFFYLFLFSFAITSSPLDSDILF